jgi:hypothetical protein
VRDDGVGQHLNDDFLERIVASGETVEEQLEVVEGEVLH